MDEPNLPEQALISIDEHAALLEALEAADRATSEAELVLLGDGDPLSLEALIAAYRTARSSRPEQKA